MGFLSENVIPGDHGKVFGTNATTHQDLIKIQSAIVEVDGVKDVLITEDVFPRELTIHTEKVVSVEAFEKAVIAVGFHVVPKATFRL